MIKILLVDDHQVLRSGLRMLIETESDLTIVGETADGDNAIQLASDLNPDIIILDLSITGKSGLQVLEELKKKASPIKTIVLSMYTAHEVIAQTMRAGAVGYVPKSAAHEELIKAIRVVHNGNVYLHPLAATAIIANVINTTEQSQYLEILSNRERKIARKVALGYTSNEIAEELSLSPKTIETYRRRVMKKLNFVHRWELVDFAIRTGLLASE